MGKIKNSELEKLNYASYLKIPELLNLQERKGTLDTHSDEIFFIIIHQAMELWFKEILHETEFLQKAFQKKSISLALKVLKRNTAILDLLIKQINLLSTLTPIEFAQFRDSICPASGLQSLQFRVMEYTYGYKESSFLNLFPKGSHEHNVLTQAQQNPTVYDWFIECLSQAGHSIPPSVLKRDFSKTHTSNSQLRDLLKGIYEKPEEDYHWVLLFEALLDFDEKFLLWRNTHIIMVERTIGYKKGTGGSSGVEFLRKRLSYKFFPELWELRTFIGGNY